MKNSLSRSGQSTEHIISFYLHCSPTRWIALLHSFFSEELRQRELSNLPKVPILVSDGAPVPSQAVWPQSPSSCLIMILCIVLWWSHDFNSPYACIIIIPLSGRDGMFRKYLQIYGLYQIFNTRVPFSCFSIHTPRRPVSLWENEGRAGLGLRRLPPWQFQRSMGRVLAEEEPQSGLTF